jgi:hypothetical protein
VALNAINSLDGVGWHWNLFQWAVGRGGVSGSLLFRKSQKSSSVCQTIRIDFSEIAVFLFEVVEPIFSRVVASRERQSPDWSR